MTPAATLPEVREDAADPATAAIYAEIRTTLGAPTVNYIWRHLATLPGELQACWTAVTTAAPYIRAALPAGAALRDRLIRDHALPDLTPDSLPPGASDVIESYNRGNAWNLLSMTALAAARTSQAIDPTRPTAPARALPQIAPPPYPRDDQLTPETHAHIATLSQVGPAAPSGVRPSLWVHLGPWPDTLAALTPATAATLASPAFRAAHAELLQATPALLGLDLPPPAITAPPQERPADQAIRRFRSRIAEMVLIGRLLALGPPA